LKRKVKKRLETIDMMRIDNRKVNI